MTMLFRSLAALACGWLLAAAAAAAAAERPNVLLILTDDQGYGDLSLHGNPVLDTPVLDRLGQQSARFDRFYVSPVCAPTRAALLTGRYALRCGVWGVTHGKEMLRPEEVTIAETLAAAGYATGCFGKWHNGEQYPYTPTGQGFHEFIGFTNGHWNHYFDTPLLHGAQFRPTEGYLPDVLTDAAIDFLTRHRAGPFFCYVPYNTPHTPVQVPDQYFERYKAQGLDNYNAGIYAMCANIDDNVGRLLAALEQLDLAENTIVVFLTDNGPNGARFNAGMKGVKGSVHEGGVRVPLFIRWPGKIEPRLVRPIAAHIDLYPTLLELCGVGVPADPPLDGASLRPLLLTDGRDWPARTLFVGRDQNDKAKFPGAVRTDRWRAVNEGRGWQLYDMPADPGQQRDVAADHPQVVAELAAAYDRYFADAGRVPRVRYPLPVGYAEHNPVTLLAPQAGFGEPVRFHGGPGYSNDWLTGWSSPQARAWFEIDVVRPGRYAVSLAYLSPAASAGTRVRATFAGAMAPAATAATLEADTPVAESPDVPLPHRDGGKPWYANRRWGELKLGETTLAAGRQMLAIELARHGGGEALELKSVTLERLD